MMRRKPMLCNKIAEQGGGREVIGLIGTHHGVGVTYTGLMLAFYMGEELGIKTAYVECNGHQDMERIRIAYEWQREEVGSFSYHQITCYKEVSPTQISEILGEDYRCIIFDFGTDFLSNREEYLRCSTKLVVGGRSPWDIQKLECFMEKAEGVHCKEDWRYVIPQADKHSAAKISNKLRRKVWPVPMNEEPTIPSPAINRFFRELLLI